MTTIKSYNKVIITLFSALMCPVIGHYLPVMAPAFSFITVIFGILGLTYSYEISGLKSKSPIIILILDIILLVSILTFSTIEIAILFEYSIGLLITFFFINYINSANKDF